jgi:hypothetical protein
MRSRTGIASSDSTSVRKPTRPTFTPSTGTSAREATCAARRNVPSPPTDTMRSSPRANAVERTESSASAPSSRLVAMLRSSSQEESEAAASTAAERAGCTTNPTAFMSRSSIRR